MNDDQKTKVDWLRDKIAKLEREETDLLEFVEGMNFNAERWEAEFRLGNVIDDLRDDYKALADHFEQQLAEAEAPWKVAAKYAVFQASEMPTGAWLVWAGLHDGTRRWKAYGVGHSFAEAIRNLQEEVVTEEDVARVQAERLAAVGGSGGTTSKEYSITL